MAAQEHGAPVIWLRQSARFTVGEQRRTVEIAIPVHPGASAEEIERLLGEADAGMAALTRHLDARIGALLAEAAAPGERLPATSAPAPAMPASERPAQPASSAPPAIAARPAAASMAPPPRPADEPARVAERPPAESHLAPSRSSAAPSPSTTPSVPPPRPAQPPAPSAPLTRPEFLTETRELGLTPPQVMQRLQVRSLDGLNLREALDLLRRQVLDEAGPAPTMPPAPRAEPAPAFFDEEDDYDITFSLPDESDAGADGYAASLDDMMDDEEVDGARERDGREGLADLPDVPDFDEPAPSPPAHRGAAAASTASAPAERGTPAAVDPLRARARELLERFRAITPGGAGEPHQLKAYTNLIVSQLDATQAGTLVRGIWGVAPNRLGSDQLYALIQWGKEDAFAEEAPAVLVALRVHQAERGGTANTPAHDSGGDGGNGDTGGGASSARSNRSARAPRQGGHA